VGGRFGGREWRGRALSIRALEGSRWRGGGARPQAMGFKWLWEWRRLDTRGSLDSRTSRVRFGFSALIDAIPCFKRWRKAARYAEESALSAGMSGSQRPFPASSFAIWTSPVLWGCRQWLGLRYSPFPKQSYRMQTEPGGSRIWMRVENTVLPTPPAA